LSRKEFDRPEDFILKEKNGERICHQEEQLLEGQQEELPGGLQDV